MSPGCCATRLLDWLMRGHPPRQLNRGEEMTGTSISALGRIAGFALKMRNVDPYGRIFESDGPLTMAPIACSRMPKCMFRPAPLLALRLPASDSFNSVWLTARDPPLTQQPRSVLRKHAARQTITEAIPFLSAGNTGSSASIRGSRTALHQGPGLSQLGMRDVITLEQLEPCSANSRPEHRRPRQSIPHTVGTRNFSSSGQP